MDHACCVYVQLHWLLLTEGYVNTHTNEYSAETAEKLIIWLSYLNTQLALSLSPSIYMITSISVNNAEVDRGVTGSGNFSSTHIGMASFAALQTHVSPHSVSEKVSFWSGGRVSPKDQIWSNTINQYYCHFSIFCSSPCLINVIPVCLSINLYEAGAQWLSKTNQSCWTAPLLNGRSLAELKETEKYGLGAGKEGCLVHFFKGVGSSNSGVSAGKNISSIMECGWACHHYQWEEEACQSTKEKKTIADKE